MPRGRRHSKSCGGSPVGVCSSFVHPFFERACAVTGSRRCAVACCKRGVSWGKRISPFHCESSLAHLRRVCRSDAGELRAAVVDDVEVAVGPVVVSQPNIGAHGLRVRRVYLNEARERQETGKGIIPLQARQHYGEIAVRQRQSKSVPGLGSRNREFRGRAIVGAHSKFIESSAVVPAKAFKEVVGKPPVLS